MKNRFSKSVEDFLSRVTETLSEGPEWPPPCPVELVINKDLEITESGGFQDLSLLSEEIVLELQEILNDPAYEDGREEWDMLSLRVAASTGKITATFNKLPAEVESLETL